jgi:Glycosyltransferase Family 4
MSPLAQDARILRQIRHLRQRHDVMVIAENPPPVELSGASWLGYDAGRGRLSRLWRAVRRRSGTKLGMKWLERLWRWSPESRAVRKALEANRPDLLLVNEVNPLPVCAAWTKDTGCPMLVDLHEYYPEKSHEEDFIRLDRPCLEHLLRASAHQISLAMSVNEPIAERYQTEFGIPCEVLYNAEDITAPPTFRPVNPARIDLVHVGLLDLKRQPHHMVEAMVLAPECFHLHLYFIGDQEALNQFDRDCERIAPGRVTLHPPVPPSAITETMAQHDIGISVIPPVTWNWVMTAPNKFFSFVAAGLGMVLAPKPWKKSMSERFGFAELTNGYEAEDIAAVLRLLTPERIEEMKRNSVKAASELNGQAMCERLLRFCEMAVSKRSKPGAAPHAVPAETLPV